ncbi:16964_t:CDS:1 [Gigaspora margarita]|uniref:16964_t:CDS:1 n=1 Tax=Gigaspora margarita TaxID=4874 RepID=A0ABM8VW47_GIGMA|nr:16964_t:CDS:1 [Gigaspora margarita]
MAGILSIDPSGTSISGLFYFENWNSWEISSIKAKKWLEQAEKIENYLKNKQVEVLLIETTNLYKKSGYTYEMPALIKLVGLLEYLAGKLNIECHLISNRFMPQWEQEAKEGKIAGLELKEVKGKMGRPKNV